MKKILLVMMLLSAQAKGQNVIYTSDIKRYKLYKDSLRAFSKWRTDCDLFFTNLSKCKTRKQYDSVYNSAGDYKIYTKEADASLILKSGKIVNRKYDAYAIPCRPYVSHRQVVENTLYEIIETEYYKKPIKCIYKPAVLPKVDSSKYIKIVVQHWTDKITGLVLDSTKTYLTKSK